MTETGIGRCRLQVVLVQSSEPGLYDAVISLNESYSGSELLKEALRCLARREGLLPPGTTLDKAAVPA